MKIKIKSILNIVLALNLTSNLVYADSIISHAITMHENESGEEWQTKANMLTKRAFSNAEVIGNKIYVIGGANANNLNKTEVYDIESNSWSSNISQMPTIRREAGSAVVDSKIYVIGGRSGADILNTIEVYDPATDTWETKTSMPTPRFDLSCSVIDGKIYAMGGNKTMTAETNIVEVYDPKTDRWETKASMSIIRTEFSSSVINNKIYCIGGDVDEDYKTIEVYDPKTNKWEVKTTLPNKRHSFTAEELNGKIYILGGDALLYNTRTVDIYDIINDTWSVGSAKMPKETDGMCSVVTGDNIYVIGGYNSGYLSDVQMYTPDINTLEYRAKKSVSNAEISREVNDIETARNLVNQLIEGDLKTILQDRLNDIIPILELDVQSTSNSLDLYIKPESILTLSLDTNSIIFENFNGISDMIKENAVTLTVTSSLPYEINTYLVSEIKSIDGSKTIDKSILNIKANSESNYNTFNDINTPIKLLDIQNSGLTNTHGIDLKLDSNVSFKTDAYKTTLQFEVNQK